MKDFDEEKVEGKTQKEEGLWDQFTGRVQEAWGSLSDDDLQRFKGRRDQLIGKIKERTGAARVVIAEKLDEIAEELGYRFGSSDKKEDREDKKED